MLRFLAKFENAAYALLRIVAGLLFAFHGVQKMFGVLSDQPQPEMFSLVWIGGIIELVGGFLIAIGFQTRLAAFLCSGTMAVAYIKFHWKLQTDQNFFPAINQGELAVVYCFLFFFIACRGGGVAAIDKRDA